MSQEKPDETKDKELLSLKDFIDDYQRTITVIGVFVASGLLWKNIQPVNSVPYISYLCFLITIPLLLEVRKGYDYYKASWNLVIFIYIFQGILVLTAYNLVVDYPDHLEKIVIGTIFTGMFLFLMALINKWAFKTKTKDYKTIVELVENLEKSGVPREERNKLVTEANVGLRWTYCAVSSIEVIALIFAVIVSILIAGYLSSYVHATFDQMYDRKIEIKIPSELLTPNK